MLLMFICMHLGFECHEGAPGRRHMFHFFVRHAEVSDGPVLTHNMYRVELG